MKHICYVDWIVDGENLFVSNPAVAATGTHLRLGRLREDGTIQYSDGTDGPHQPFEDFYTDDAPRARLYRNGKLFLDHWGDYMEVGNPWRDEEWLYFEARRGCLKAPQGWELWRYNLKTDDSQYLRPGANPCVYDGVLYFCHWRHGKFDIGITTVKD